MAPPLVKGQVTSGVARALVRAPLSQDEKLAGMLALKLRDRSAKREEPVRIVMGPTRLW